MLALLPVGAAGAEFSVRNGSHFEMTVLEAPALRRLQSGADQACAVQFLPHQRLSRWQVSPTRGASAAFVDGTVVYDSNGGSIYFLRSDIPAADRKRLPSHVKVWSGPVRRGVRASGPLTRPVDGLQAGQLLTCHARLQILQDGRVGDVTVNSSKRCPDAVHPAVRDEVEGWRYRPVVLDGRAILPASGSCEDRREVAMGLVLG